MKEQLEKLLKRSKAELEGDQSYLASMVRWTQDFGQVAKIGSCS